MLSACQIYDTARLKQLDYQPKHNQAYIYCSGTTDCIFERVDEIAVVPEGSKRIDARAIQHKLVRLNQSYVGKENSLYLAVSPKQHEIVIRFYPISKDKAEKLHLIHSFKADQKYTLHMYRDRSEKNGSLLANSAPSPLCVELLQENQIVRRFCKPYNALTGLGEFVEQKNLKSR